MILINNAPYGDERLYNALRLAMNLQKKGSKIKIFLLADAVFSVLPNHVTPQGYYNVERMIKSIISKDGKIHV